MKKLATAVLIMLGVAGTVQAAGDAGAGQQKAAACAGCHGVDGNSIVPTFPKLAGQGERYLTKQMQEFKAGKRVDPIMAGQSAGLNDQDMADISAYFAAQAAKSGVGNAELAKAGAAVYQGGNMDSGVAACKACHGPKGKGMPEAGFPGLAGQHVAYVTKQLQAFRTGARANDLNGMMGDVARKMTDAEIQAVAEYIAGL